MLVSLKSSFRSICISYNVGITEEQLQERVSHIVLVSLKSSFRSMCITYNVGITEMQLEEHVYHL